MSSTDLSSTIYLTIYDLSNNPYAIGSTFTLTDNTNTFYFTYDSSSNVSGTNEFVFDVSYNTLGYTVTNSISTTTYSCQVTVGSLTYTITNAANISYNSNYDQVEIFLHVDSCLPIQCKICKLDNCAHRSFEFLEQLSWNTKNLWENEKHSLE